MVKVHQINPVIRAVAVIGAVMALVTGMTLAATSTATLQSNSITMAAATADLKLWDGDSFESTAPGFNFSGLVPGEESEQFNFYFLNDGNSDMNVTASIPIMPDFSGTSFTAADVTLKFYGAESCLEGPFEYTMAELNNEEVKEELPCNPLEVDDQGVVGEDATNEANYRVTATIASTVDLGDTSETVPSFDIVFTGDTDLGDG